MSVSSKMKLIKIEPNQGMSFKTQWVNASLRTVLFIDIFLICSVILSLKLLERGKRGTMANADEREILLWTVAGICAKAGRFAAVFVGLLFSVCSFNMHIFKLLSCNKRNGVFKTPCLASKRLTATSEKMPKTSWWQAGFRHWVNSCVSGLAKPWTSRSRTIPL